MLAAIRAGDVNIALFVHILGAMLLVGSLLAVAYTRVLAARATEGTGMIDRLTFKATILGVLPAYIVMRGGAQWVEAQENLPKEVEDSTWLGIGYMAADLGALLVLASVIVSVVGLRRIPDGGGRGGAKAVGIMAALLVVVYVVAIWAMSAKPA